MSTPAPFHVYQIYIRASAEQVWQAITDPEFTKQYFHHTAFESSLDAGSPYRMVLPDGSDAVVGTIEEIEANKRLVITWRTLYDPAAIDEPPSRVEWLLTEGPDGVTKLTMIHRDLGLSPVTSANVADGWHWVLQSMKTLLETGAPLAGSPPVDGDGDGETSTSRAVEQAEAEQHRRDAVAANNATWELLGLDRELTSGEVDDLLGRAYASTYHWRRAARRGPENDARGSWLVSHVHAVLGQGDLALHHADQSMLTVDNAALQDFDRAYAHEARARALACLGRTEEATIELKAAYAVPIAHDEDRSILHGDLAAAPWYGVTI